MNYASSANLLRKEEIIIAPYGTHSKDTRGRLYPEEEHDYRGCYQRDKDRILHTTSFRRLEYKTQVFVNDEGDYYRTRLTHTLEVAQIGRTLARFLGGNEDLAEAICLAHDMGHPPFGHSGEAVLAKKMVNHGSFNHNRQTLRIVTKLEKRYTGFSGLNLSYETLEGIAKHETEYDTMGDMEFNPNLRGSLEAQIANMADETAYSAHDLDDGLRSGLLTLEMVEKLDIWRLISDNLHFAETKLSDLDRHRFINALTSLEMDDIVEHTQQMIQKNRIESVSDLVHMPYNIVSNSDTMVAMNRELKDFLFHNMYQHYRVMRMSAKADMILSRLFDTFLSNPKLMPTHIQESIDEKGLEVAICDYIAGMTDRYATEQYKKLFDPDTLP
ncbi:MAG: deoxyguanosinetriphosphate triphosphohydrolase [Flexilinea sp.]|nr:deoxyguanosinetriphosphate triphosphohydrolase [Flexilinea sp.]